MRKLLPAFFFLIAFTSVSQNANYATHRGIDYTGNVVSINAKSYHFETGNRGCCDSKLYFTVMNSAGKAVSEQIIPVTVSSLVNGIKIIATHDKSLVILGRALNNGSHVSCDVGSMKNFFVKLDTLGNKLFEIFLPTNSSTLTYGDITDLVQYSDSSYYFVSANSLFHYSKTGQSIATFTTGLTSINSIATLANGNLLISGEYNSIYRHMEITTAGANVQQSNPASPVSKYMQTSSGNLLALAGGILQRYNSNFIVLNSSPLGSDSITDFTLRNDSIFSTGINKSTATPFYGILDQSLSWIAMSPCTYKNIVPKGISLNGGRVNINTQGTSMVPNSSKFKGFYQFPVSGSFSSMHDIGVTSFALTSYTNLVVMVNPAPGTQYQEARPTFNLDVVVKNYSTDTIHSFYLNSYFYLYYDCKRGFQKLYNATIVPQGSVTVNTGNYDGAWFSPPSNVQPLSTQNVNFCFYTTVPDASNDTDVSNDMHCDSLMVTNFTSTGIKQNSETEDAILVYPNPFNSALHIQSDVIIKRVEVYTVIGALQAVYEVNDNAANLELVLPAGIYFVKLETEKGTLIKKVVKQ